MVNVFVEPLPKGRAGPIQGYALEVAGGTRTAGTSTYSTQAEAVRLAKLLGHSPLIARVRVTDKGRPDHWRSAE
jgi:hypothetical protein